MCNFPGARRGRLEPRHGDPTGAACFSHLPASLHTCKVSFTVVYADLALDFGDSLFVAVVTSRWDNPAAQRPALWMFRDHAGLHLVIHGQGSGDTLHSCEFNLLSKPRTCGCCELGDDARWLKFCLLWYADRWASVSAAWVSSLMLTP
jgi:hypothetical protein